MEGPQQILAWAASHDPTIEWEGKYAHRCQSCLRLYRDPKVRAVIKEKHEERIADVLFREWMLFDYELNASEEPQADPHETSGDGV